MSPAPKVYEPCRKLVGDDGQTCGKPARVAQAGALGWCQACRERLPLWPGEAVPAPEPPDERAAFPKSMFDGVPELNPNELGLLAYAEALPQAQRAPVPLEPSAHEGREVAP